MKSKMNELRAALKSSKVKFQYTKMNGEVRKAYGTQNPEFIPDDFKVTSVNDSDKKVVTYFDLDKIGWRNVSVTSEVTI